MHESRDYTSRSRQFVARFPILNYVLKQASFWIVAFTLLSFLLYMSGQSFSQFFLSDVARKNMNNTIWPNLLIGFICGVVYGTGLGLMDYLLDRQVFRNKPLGKIILIKALFGLALLVLCFSLIRYVLFGAIVLPTLNRQSSLSNRAWDYTFWLVLVYSFFMMLVINFILQVNKKFGPGVLLPILLGKYRSPREEERIFMFMDLKSSTALAETLGHLKYSGFIRDSFMDINQVLQPYDAEVYQYVGDEIVVSWKIPEGLKNFSCIQFFFACEQQFQKRADYYISNYGSVPEFKAGLHMGKVTAVEIGEIKRDIAYHGDTLNTAARIQSMCNDYSKKLLTSAYLVEQSGLDTRFRTETLGSILLKGKTVPVGIASIEASL